MQFRECPLVIDWLDEVNLLVVSDWYEENGFPICAINYRKWAAKVGAIKAVKVGDEITYEDRGEILTRTVVSKDNSYVVVHDDQGVPECVFLHQLGGE